MTNEEKEAQARKLMELLDPLLGDRPWCLVIDNGGEVPSSLGNLTAYQSKYLLAYTVAELDTYDEGDPGIEVGPIGGH